MKAKTVPIDVLAAEYQAGATMQQLAEKYGCTRQNISMRFLNAGVVTRSGKPPRTLPDRVCPTCGRTFRPRAQRQRFCRSECIRQKAVCKHGHALNEDTRYHHPSANARCKVCQKLRDQEYRKRKRTTA